MTVLPQQRGASFLIDQVEPEDIVCPEDMGDDERLLMRSIKEFAEQEVQPMFDEIDRRNIDVIRPLFKKAADLGLFMAEVPEALGGLELSLLAIAGMSESRSYLGGLSSTVFAHQGIGTLPLINFGTQAQIDRYLARCMNGDLMAAFALTEPGSGSDAMNIKTTAVLNAEGTHYVVNGAKQWITNAGWADLFILFAKVDGTAFSAFLLERDSSGLTIGDHEKLLGLDGSSVCAMQLDDVAIPVENVLGEVGKGHKVAMCTLNLGRMKMSANCAGTAKKILATTTQYATERRQFGHPIADFGLIQRKLADMAARAYGAESVAYRTAGLVYTATEALRRTGTDSLDLKLQTLTEFSVECAMAKVIGSETYNGLADEALQVYGGNGYSEEYPAARWYRDSRITRIYEGTSEICRLGIAKTILKRADRGQLALREAVSGLPPPAVAHSGDSLVSLRTQVHALKQVFLFVLGEVWDGVDGTQLLEPEHQQFLGSLADIAIETYLAESTVLRVLKLTEARPDTDRRLETALARLVFFRAADRVRQESTEVVAALLEGDRLTAALDRVAAWLPTPAGLIETRTFIARGLVARKGVLP
ncbi:MAG: acyl-CoA dehydrogenase family protein [Vicinamibacterales bacterium]|jgi:alkylation response protein AidB-like acyl-CoA dehydrogenase|nr:acyl-CoA dehydrogenase family protein [Vicinamibacterales bacterium]HIN10001.1 acyl-CoA dehydrogenase [Acidobacteriota bacterium]